jgi:HSP20 family protein
MSGNIEPSDWFRRFFSNNNWFGDKDFGNGDFLGMKMFRDFNEIQSQMQKMFDQFDRDLSDGTSKEMVKEYQAPDGSKIRQVGPIVYGYSVTIGPDGKPIVQEFGNVRPNKGGSGLTGRTGPQLNVEREPLLDINVMDNQGTVILEMPGVNKESIKINAFDDTLEVSSIDPKRKYHKAIELPKNIDVETVKSKFNNGILEIIFNIKKETKSKGKEIKID